MVTAGSLPGGLSLNASTGAMRARPAAGSFAFTVPASNGGVAAQALSLSRRAGLAASPALPNGAVGAAYSQTLAAGSSSSYGWVIAAGALPIGLSFNAGQARSGAQRAGDRELPCGSPAQARPRRRLDHRGPRVNVTTTTLPNGTAGAAYSQSLAATGGGGTAAVGGVGALLAGSSCEHGRDRRDANPR